MIEYSLKSIIIICLCIILAILCFVLGFAFHNVNVTKNQCEVYYDKTNN